VVVTTGSGSITSAPAALTVLSSPVIVSDLVSVTTNVNRTAQFSIVAAGTAPLSYQWFFNGSPVPNATDAVLSLTKSAAGNIYVLVSNQYGTVTSAVAELAVTLEGSVFVWGDNQASETSVPPNLTGVAQLAAGVFRLLAVRSNGTLVAWGTTVSAKAPCRAT